LQTGSRLTHKAHIKTDNDCISQLVGTDRLKHFELAIDREDFDFRQNRNRKLLIDKALYKQANYLKNTTRTA